EATAWRKLCGTTPLSQWLKCVRSQRTRPLQRRYWPRKKQRSVNQAGRKKRCPGLAGNTSSSRRKTRTRKKKLRPAEKASAYRAIGVVLDTGLSGGFGRLGRGWRLRGRCKPVNETPGKERFGPAHDGRWRFRALARGFLGCGGFRGGLP